MNVKIQGGDKAYSNTGSCTNVAYYLEHEDYHRMEQSLEVEPFFTQNKDSIEKDMFILEMDNNKAKLCKSDAKFYVLTISPSKEEVEKMGNSEQERSRRFKQFIREEVIPQYANGFGKNLTASDIMYFAKIHHNRNEKSDNQMHAHIVISRKTKDNRLKISPKTTHKKAKTSGVVKSGFDRTAFFQNVETSFDRMFQYERSLDEKFEYLNIVKNGTIKDLERIVLNDLEDRIPKIERQNIEKENISVGYSMPNLSIEKEAILENEMLDSFQPFVKKDSEFDEFADLKRKKRRKGRNTGLSM